MHAIYESQFCALLEDLYLNHLPCQISYTSLRTLHKVLVFIKDFLLREALLALLVLPHLATGWKMFDT